MQNAAGRVLLVIRLALPAWAAVLLFVPGVRAVLGEDRAPILGSAVERASPFARVAPDSREKEEVIHLTFALPMRDYDGAVHALEEIYNPSSPNYKRYLTSEEFGDRYGPTQADYDAIKVYIESLGMIVTDQFPDRLILDASASERTVESGFGITIEHYRRPDGTLFRMANQNPLVPPSIAKRLQGIYGIGDSFHSEAGDVVRQEDGAGAAPPGTGVMGYLAPNDIKKAYDLNDASEDGSGEILGVIAFGDYQDADIEAYRSKYSLPKIAQQITRVMVPGEEMGASPGDPEEVEADIELMLALAPKAKEIRVYETPNLSKNTPDILCRIANEPPSSRPDSISTSFGFPEARAFADLDLRAKVNLENCLFLQMALQGQSFFAFAGDHGPYYGAGNQGGFDPCTLTATDPAAQPFVTAVGGTTLSLKADQSYGSEIPWKINRSCADTGELWSGGGGASQIWSLPYYQQTAVSSLSPANPLMRHIPDVSLNASTPYSVYINDKWTYFTGTSAAAPLWAALGALIDQRLKSQSLPSLGFLSPSLYSIAASSQYAEAFHDIIGGDNGKYPATPNYDLATGLGTPIMDRLIEILGDQTGMRQAPVVHDQAILVPENGNIEFVPDVQPAGDGPFKYNIVSSPAHGELSGIPPEYAYKPKSNFIGTDSIQFYVDSPYGSSKVAEITFNVSKMVIPRLPPSAPIGLTASPGFNRVSLRWSPVDGAASYHLYYGWQSGLTPMNSVKLELANVLSYDHKDLSSGCLDNHDCYRYYYAVAAVNQFGEGPFSPEVTAIPMHLGDVNGDGKVDIRDAIAALEILSGIATPVGDQSLIMDENQDGQVDIRDVTLLLERIARK